MKLSIVIICWNDSKVILNCLRSIYSNTKTFDFEVIVSDNGSTDCSLAMIRVEFSEVRIIENGANLGFAKGNNAGIRAAVGEYILILNPDTILHEHALEKLINYANQHPGGGAFGCKVLNADGSFQNPARPLPTVRGYLIAALYQRWLGHISSAFAADTYVGWKGDTERTIGYQSGCCILFVGSILKKLNGFDERFFYHYEETDLCKRVWAASSSILYCPDAVITHLGGQSVGRFPIRFALETCRSRYRYFFKHYGANGARRLRQVWLIYVGIRWIGYSLKKLFQSNDSLTNRLKMYEVLFRWNREVDPLLFNQTGEEPDLGYEPLARAPTTQSYKPV